MAAPYVAIHQESGNKEYAFDPEDLPSGPGWQVFNTTGRVWTSVHTIGEEAAEKRRQDREEQAAREEAQQRQKEAHEAALENAENYCEQRYGAEHADLIAEADWRASMRRSIAEKATRVRRLEEQILDTYIAELNELKWSSDLTGDLAGVVGVIPRVFKGVGGFVVEGVLSGVTSGGDAAEFSEDAFHSATDAASDLAQEAGRPVRFTRAHQGARVADWLNDLVSGPNGLPGDVGSRATDELEALRELARAGGFEQEWAEKLANAGTPEEIAGRIQRVLDARKTEQAAWERADEVDEEARETGFRQASDMGACVQRKYSEARWGS